MDRRKQITIIISSSLLLLLLVSFSYYLINVSNSNKELVKSSTSTISLVYTDCAESTETDCARINKNLVPGEDVTKTFRVENTGTVTTRFEIIFKSLTNNFVDDELVYKVFDENDELIINEKPVPYALSEGTTIFSDSVRAGSTKNYKMVVTFKKTDYDQEKNLNSSYDIVLGIKTDSTVVSRSTLNKLQSLNSSIKVKAVTPNFANISPLPSKYEDAGMSSQESVFTPNVNTNYITYGDSYVFNEFTGRYDLVNPQTCRWNECYTSLTGKYFCYNDGLYTSSTPQSYSNQRSLFQIQNTSTSTEIHYKSNTTSVIEYDDLDSGIFEMDDDYGQSLYFRGNVENNYVKFAKNKSGMDMYWRIIRINGDGTIRLIYDGTSAHENGDESRDRIVGYVPYNVANDLQYDIGLVGYMFGNFAAPIGCECTSHASNGYCIYTCTGGGSTSYEEAHENINSSTMKTFLENWYEENIKNTGYFTYIADEIFCNDRSIDKEARPNDLGYGQNRTIFAGNTRLNTNKNPSLICSRKEDAFTKNDIVNGNGKLTYPIGLITADELSIGGFVYGGSYNYKTYLYKGSRIYSMTPSQVVSYGYPTMLTASVTIGHISLSSESASTVPVINLTAEAVQSFTGDGTINNPFTISE